MTIASLLLVLCTAASPAATEPAAEPILLDFHADWCGPCQKMRPVVKQLIRNNYPVRSVDMDNDPDGLAKRYDVTAVPTFIVVDGSGKAIDRIKGPASAGDLVRFYQAAAAKAAPRPAASARAEAGTQAPSTRDDDTGDDRPPARGRNDAERSAGETGSEFANPNPWESSVRIRVVGAQSTGFGSGTIIHSTPDESLILTCAHIFHLEGKKQAKPAEFPRKIIIDLFDGKLQVQGKQAGRVHFLESVPGTAVDYDFTRDVGLIRIRPGRQLPASRVVPAHWEPESFMRMLTVGCSEGHDATAWHTQIIKPRVQNFLAGRPAYEAIECWKAPKQGRSGGGLFTDDGFIAGVCDFAEPQGDHGLYATPRSIYYLLDRNKLMALYSPPQRGSGTLLADNRAGARVKAAAAAPYARAQTPDSDEPTRGRGRASAARDADNDDLPPPPPPTFLGILMPEAPTSEPNARAASATTRRTNWQPIRVPASGTGSASGERAASSEADRDRYVPPQDGPDHTDDNAREDLEIAGSDADGPGAKEGGGKSRWRAVKTASVTPVGDPEN